MSKIEDVLLEATGQKPQKKGEDRQKYLLRVALAANDKLSEEEWDQLEAEAGVQDWVTAAVKADNEEKTIKDFPDLESEESEDDVEAEEPVDDSGEDPDTGEDEPEEGEEDEVKTTKKSGGGKKPAAKAPAKKTEAKKPDTKKTEAKKSEAAPAKKAAAGKSTSGGVKKISMRRALKQMVVKSPKLSVDDLIERLEKKGYDKPSKVTITTIRADTRDTIKVLNEAGLANVELQ